MAEKLVNEFLLGCDPEFVVLGKKGQLLNCDDYLSYEGEIGLDHAGWVLEFRPQPTHGSYALIRRIKKLIDSGWDGLVPGLAKARAGAYVQTAEGERNRISLGGHIHIGLTPYTQGGTQSAAHGMRIKALDAFTKCIEDLEILPGIESTARRTNGHYGRYGDVRFAHSFGAEKPEYRTEYRTMGSWLFDPKVAMVCLTGAKLAAAAPKESMEVLPLAVNSGKSDASYAHLKKFFGLFAGKDINADRVIEKLLVKPIKSLQVDPTVDFRERWERLTF